QMADRAPGCAQAVVEFIHRQHQASPCRLRALLGEQIDNRSAVVGNNLVNGRFYMLSADRRERWQVVGLQQRVVRAHGLAPWQKETPTHLNYNRRRPQLSRYDGRAISPREGAYQWPFAPFRTIRQCWANVLLSTIRRW